MSPKYPICHDCYFHDREPAICEGCAHGSEYEPDEDESVREQLRRKVGMPDKVVRSPKRSVLIYRSREQPAPEDTLYEEPDFVDPQYPGFDRTFTFTE